MIEAIPQKAEASRPWHELGGEAFLMSGVKEGLCRDRTTVRAGDD